MRLRTGYLDHAAETLDEAMAIIRQSCAEKKPVSVGLLGNAAEILPQMLEAGILPDLLTDQTSAHDPINGYLPPAGPWPNGSSGANASPKPWPGRPRQHGHPCPRDAGIPGARRADHRLRQQHPPGRL
jgi:hypothetical protein